MGKNDEVSLPVLAGTEDDVLTALWSLCYDMQRGMDTGPVLDAIEHIQQGNRCVRVAGELFEVVDPPWSIEQDVFGCPLGRDCTDVTADQRQGFEAMIAQLQTADGKQRPDDLEGRREPQRPAAEDPDDDGRPSGARKAGG